ncbi:hypothetical protein J5U23_00700 [Saccharolobus shibatae B12]|uniref:Uncharacterized protein n=1 Tax=Saccharolobus shibatae (strain ATCC 51178 / DSM 5389 / JCM 8931 / NBRC 15437 / B12) TaxID=523848 RepID=A0A8F5BM34_SACSH|nr:hypothetical protein [Saccharolobus shibatae]QXJ27832.1 hypothetical protein J5U23_00700 [Saccharolobus shibatae B12]
MFKKLPDGAVIEYNNGYTVKLKVEGRKLRLREELNGNPITDTVLYLNEDQAKQIRDALKKANNADEVMQLLQGVMK